MATSITANRASKRISINPQAATTAATSLLTAATIAATILQSDFFMYLCGTLALMGVYTLDRIEKKGGEK